MSSSTRTLTGERIEEGGPEVVQQLQRQVANAFILYANYKHYHWETFGPLFRDLHLMFDEFANAVLETADEFAERLRFRGEAPVFDYRQILEVSALHPSVRGETMREMVEEANENLRLVINEIRRAAGLAEQAHDPGSVDLFSKVVQIHEKHEWFLREILRQNDGLTK